MDQTSVFKRGKYYFNRGMRRVDQFADSAVITEAAGELYTVYREIEIIVVESGEEDDTTARKARTPNPTAAAGTPPPNTGLIRCDCDMLACLWGKTSTV